MSRFRKFVEVLNASSTKREIVTLQARYCNKNLVGQSIRLISTERKHISTTPVPEFESGSIKTHDDLYKLSLEKPDLFWGKLARSRLNWFKDFSLVRDCDLSKGYIRWFLDGKINASGKNNFLFQPGNKDLFCYLDIQGHNYCEAHL